MASCAGNRERDFLSGEKYPEGFPEDQDGRTNRRRPAGGSDPGRLGQRARNPSAGGRTDFAGASLSGGGAVYLADAGGKIPSEGELQSVRRPGAGGPSRRKEGRVPDCGKGHGAPDGGRGHKGGGGNRGGKHLRRGGGSAFLPFSGRPSGGIFLQGCKYHGFHGGIPK